MKNYFYCFFVAGLLTTSGCAWYKITPVSAQCLKGWGKNYKDDGYIIYQPELYFAVTVTPSTNTNTPANESVTVAPLYLPNHAEAYRVTTHNFLAKADFEFAFQNGWQLTQLNDKSDNSTVATALASQLQAVLSAAGPFFKINDNQPHVFLYRPQYGDDGMITNFISAGELKI